MVKICKRCKKQFIAKFATDVFCNSKKDCKKPKRKQWEKVYPIKTIKGISKKRETLLVNKPLPASDKAKVDKRLNEYYKKTYNITIEDYRTMQLQQENRCAICGSIATMLFVDHNHTTGKVTLLLCPSCNTGLGLFKDSITVIESAIGYLVKHKPNI